MSYSAGILWVSLVVAALGGSMRAGSPAQAPPPDPAADIAAEFPQYDGRILSVLRTGLSAKLAAARLAQAPDDLETLGLLFQQNRRDDILRALRRIVDVHPDRIGRAFEIVAQNQYKLRDYRSAATRDALDALVAEARQKIPRLPREDAAQAARSLLSLENQLKGGGSAGWEAGLAALVTEYRDTEVASLSDVDLLMRGRVTPAQLDGLERYARDHPGTVAGAKALYMKGFQLQTNVAISGLEPQGSDPTDRFLQVLAIVKELESGSHPASEWTERARTLVPGFFSSNPSYAPGNVERMLAGYYAFVVERFARRDPVSAAADVEYIVTTKMGDLYARQGDRIAGVEGMFTELEREPARRDAARFLRATFYMQRLQSERAEDRVPGLYEKAVETLTSLHREGSGLFQRKALATLASFHFFQRDYASARVQYDRYRTLYPQSPWAWVAALRVGQCDEGVGDWPRALRSYRTATATYQSPAPARVMGHVSAARAAEALGTFDAALLDYQAALAGWDNDYGPTYSIGATRPMPAGTWVPSTPEIQKPLLTARIAQLQRSAAMPGGSLLERGRWQRDHGKPADAATTLQMVVAQFPTSPAAVEARYLTHLAALDAALERVNTERTGGNDAAALPDLERLAQEPHDFAVTAAKITIATMTWKRGDRVQGERAMLAALQEWRANQAPSVAVVRQPGVAADIADIRAVVVRPRGDGVYRTDSPRWNAFTWPTADAPFVIVNADVSVKLANGETMRHTVRAPVPGVANAVFLETEQIAYLSKIMDALGGTRTRAPRAVMETPNQPVGPSLNILELWNTLFASRPGHWGGWVFETFPIIDQIAFVDAARTKAEARVTVGFSGATVILEKENGVWVARRLVDFWVT